MMMNVTLKLQISVMPCLYKAEMDLECLKLILVPNNTCLLNSRLMKNMLEHLWIYLLLVSFYFYRFLEILLLEKQLVKINDSGLYNLSQKSFGNSILKCKMIQIFILIISKIYFINVVIVTLNKELQLKNF